MYFAPVTLIFIVVCAFGWWLTQRDEKRGVVETARAQEADLKFIQRFADEEARSSLRDLKELEKDNQRLAEENRRARDLLLALLALAEEHYRQYTELDWEVLSQHLPPADVAQLRKDAGERKAELDWFTREMQFYCNPLQLAAASRAGGNFKAKVAAITADHGVPAGLNEINAAIGRLVAKGAFCHVQGTALIAHNGPLHGAGGRRTVQAIADEVITPTLASAQPALT